MEQDSAADRADPGRPTSHDTFHSQLRNAAAIFDAVNNIDRDFEPYAVRHPHVSRRASVQAAADQAAHDVLISLYPASATTLDSELQQDLAQIPCGPDKAEGIEEGQDVAAEILALRSNDGSAAILPPFVPKAQLGSYQLTPPNFAPADIIQWPQVTPFALARANEFRPGPPPLREINLLRGSPAAIGDRSIYPAVEIFCSEVGIIFAQPSLDTYRVSDLRPVLSIISVTALRI
jgi:hypothetical protein